MNKKLISFLTVIFLILLISLFYLFIRTQDTMYRAEDEAIELISYDYEIERVNKFYWSTTDQTYFSVDFMDQESNQHYAIITQEGGEITYFTPQEIINEEEALSIVNNDMTPFKVMQIRLALIEEQPVWEATIKNEDGTITYYTISATDGTWIQTIGNI